MNELSQHLTDPVLRTRLLDLSFSLHDSLGDLLNDLVVIDGGYSDEAMVRVALGRLNTASMDCLGDIELLTPILHSIRNSLRASPPMG